MLLWFFAIMDLSTVLFLFATHHDVVGWRLGLLHLSYLLIKGYAFLGDVASLLDLLIGFFFITMIIGFRSELLLWLSALYLLQKSLFSLKAYT